jgi:hypothetical protein
VLRQTPWDQGRESNLRKQREDNRQTLNDFMEGKMTGWREWAPSGKEGTAGDKQCPLAKKHKGGRDGCDGIRSHRDSDPQITDYRFARIQETWLFWEELRNCSEKERVMIPGIGLH